MFVANLDVPRFSIFPGRHRDPSDFAWHNTSSVTWKLLFGLTSHEIEIRVRYQETDGQGRVHHANYLTWFELGRVELLRAMGHSYRELEAAGVMLVVAEMNVRYFLPAVFDDVLTLRTSTHKAKGARIEHEYKILRGPDLLAQATSTVACIDRAGRVARLPKWLTSDTNDKPSIADS